MNRLADSRWLSGAALLAALWGFSCSADSDDSVGSSGLGGQGGSAGQGGFAGQGGSGGQGGFAGLGGFAGGGSGGAPAEDQCPGSRVQVGIDQQLWTGSTRELSDTTQPFCLAANLKAPEAIYELLPSQSGTLTLGVSGVSGAQPAVWIQRGSCDELASAVTCQPGQTSLEPNEVVLPVTAGEPVFAIVEVPGGVGDFLADAVVTPARCGDGALNAGEECDLGVAPEWPGCSPTSCLFLEPGLDDRCGESPVQQVADGDELTLAGHTTGYNDSTTPSCGHGQTPDAVLSFISFTPGTLDVELTSNFDAVLSASPLCGAGVLNGTLACSDAGREESVERVSFPMVPNVAHHVVVDGFDSNAWGDFELQVRFTAGEP